MVMDVNKYFLMSDRYTEGVLGVEIEVEGDRLPAEIDGWRTEHDGSLRGPSAEYVFNSPKSYDGSRKALEVFDNTLKANNSTINDSIRAGIHVHLNVQKLTLLQLITLITAYFTVENVITKLCGVGREGNLFCLRGKDAEYQIEAIVDGVVNNRLRSICNDNIRYSALNIISLRKFGSIEFRAMRTTSNIDHIWNWCRIVHNFLRTVELFETPYSVISTFSERGYVEFMRYLFPDDLFKIIEPHINEKDMICGMRNAQDIAFCVNDWGKWQEDFNSQYKKYKKKFVPRNDFHILTEMNRIWVEVGLGPMSTEFARIRNYLAARGAFPDNNTGRANRDRAIELINYAYTLEHLER